MKADGIFEECVIYSPLSLKVRVYRDEWFS